jgi:transposase
LPCPADPAFVATTGLVAAAPVGPGLPVDDTDDSGRVNDVPEYKAEVVELIRSTGKTVGQVARELDLTETAVRQWVRHADLDAGRRTDGLTTAEGEELRRLRRENQELGEEREILRKAAVFFARETDRR